MYSQPYNCTACMQYSQQIYSPSYVQQYSSRASSLDAVVQEYRGNYKNSMSAPIIAVQYNTPSFTYEATVDDYFTQQNREDHATSFLKQYRPATQFIDAAEQVEPLVREAFEKTTGTELPDNIIIQILDETEMKNAHESHNSIWSSTILGFSINSIPYKHVIVKNACLDQVMAVVGHEIGHVLTPTLPNTYDEEAKAFAFEFAWVDAIIEHNLSNLENNFTLEPAKNGLHDVAANFVRKLVQSGKEVMHIYREIAKGIMSISQCFVMPESPSKS